MKEESSSKKTSEEGLGNHETKGEGKGNSSRLREIGKEIQDKIQLKFCPKHYSLIESKGVSHGRI